MKELEYPQLKNAICVDLVQESKPKVKRYVVENLNDLKKFLKVFPNFDMKIIVNPIKQCLEDGAVVLLTDIHPASGFNTYCIESEYGLKRL